MATTNPTATDRTTRDARVRQLAAAGHSHRAIARQTGVHHTTVGRILRTTTAPVQQAERTAPEPPEQTERTTTAISGDRPAPPRTTLIKELAPTLIQDLNVLIDRRTGALPAPLDRIVRAYADRERARWSAALEHHSATEERQPSGRGPTSRAGCAVTFP